MCIQTDWEGKDLVKRGLSGFGQGMAEKKLKLDEVSSRCMNLCREQKTSFLYIYVSGQDLATRKIYGCSHESCL
jgi:hypothetical protein